MKENETPEKIYMPNELLSEEWQKHIEGEDTEYVRADAFIEKACAFIRERLIFDDNAWYTDGEVTLKDKAIEEFKKYMKGEIM